MGTFSLASYAHREPLRAGALTQSFLATHPAHAQRVVLKQLLPTFATNAEVRARWLAIASANQSPPAGHGLKVFESGEHEQAAYLALEHIEGIGLDVLLPRQRGEALDVRLAVRLAADVLEHLAAAEERGLTFAHLDVSPRSVILRVDGSVALTEHGLWNALSPADAARVRFDKGRVPYLSPELAKSLAGDARSDVFSVGVLLFELLSGARAFAGPTQLVLALAIAEGKRSSLHELRPDLPEPLRHVVEAMIAHSPEERFQSARAALNALGSACSPSSDAREGLAAWVARVQREAAAVSSSPGAASFSGAPRFAVGSAGGSRPPSTQVFDAASAADGRAAGPRAAPQAAASAAGGHRATEVLDMANLLGRKASPGALGAEPPGPLPTPGYVASPQTNGPAVSAAQASARSIGGGFVESSPRALGSEPLPPPVLDASASFNVPAPAAPPLMPLSQPSDHAARLAPPPMLADSSQRAPFGGDLLGPQLPVDLRKPEPKSLLSAPDLASRDGHTAFFKRGNAKHKQAIFVPNPLVMPPAPGASEPAALPFAQAPSLAQLPGPAPVPGPIAAAWAPSGSSALSFSAVSTPEGRPGLELAPAPLPRADDEGYRDPSGTLFQIKRYAKTRTAGEKRKTPLGVAVALAALFGFVVVTGGYLLFRLFS